MLKKHLNIDLALNGESFTPSTSSFTKIHAHQHIPASHHHHHNNNVSSNLYPIDILSRNQTPSSNHSIPPIWNTHLQLQSKHWLFLKANLPSHINLNSFGRLLLTDSLILRRSATAKMTIYLFDEVIICTQMDRSRLLQAFVPGNPIGKNLIVKGIIYIKDIKRVYDDSVATELGLTIELKRNQDSFTILFPNKTLLNCWQASIKESIENILTPSWLNERKPFDSSSCFSQDDSSHSAISVCITPDDQSPHTIEFGNKKKPYQYTGKEIFVGGIPTYITEPKLKAKSKSTIIVLLCDITGWKADDLRKMGDDFAEMGYTTIIPDIFIDNSILDLCIPDPDLDGFFRVHTSEVVSNRIYIILDAIKSSLLTDNICVIGFGWSAQYSMLINANQQCSLSIAVCPTHLHYEEFLFTRMTSPLLIILRLESRTDTWISRLRKLAPSNTKFVNYPEILTAHFALHPLIEEDEISAKYVFEDMLR